MAARSWIIAAALLIGIGAAYQAQEWRYGERLAELSAKSQKALQTAESEARANESRMQTAIDNLQAKANERETRYNADLAAANARADSLRDQRAYRTSRAIEDTRTAGGGESARQTLRVYSELLDRADARDRAVSEFADRSYDAGMTCVQAYELIRGKE